MTESKSAKIGKYEYMINISAFGMWINCMIKMASSKIKGITKKSKSLEVCTGRNCAKCPVAQSADPSVLSSPEMEHLKKVSYLLD